MGKAMEMVCMEFHYCLNIFTIPSYSNDNSISKLQKATLDRSTSAESSALNPPPTELTGHKSLGQRLVYQKSYV